MTLDEEIKYCEEVADFNTKEVENGTWGKGSMAERYCIECANERLQLAEWLKELKAYKEKESKWIQWFKRNNCKECDYYCAENNVCQSKKCTTCGCHPYIDWLDRHFCQPYKESRK